MAKKLQLRGGTTSQHSSFTGAVREVTVDTDKDVVVVHDGSTAGGIVGAKASDLTSKQDVVANVSDTEIGHLNGVTSAIQTQLDAKQATITGSATTIDTESLTASRAVISNGSQKIAVSDVTSTELGYLDGVTSAIQTQLGTKITSGSTAIVNADVNGSAGIVTSKLSGAVTSIASHGLATSATTDTTSASNISSGTLPNARISSLPTSQLTGAITSVTSHGLATSATTDTTNASNISSGTLPMARLSGTLPALNGSALTNLPGGGADTSLSNLTSNGQKLTAHAWCQNDSNGGIRIGHNISSVSASSGVFTYNYTSAASNSYHPGFAISMGNTTDWGQRGWGFSTAYQILYNSASSNQACSMVSFSA